MSQEDRKMEREPEQQVSKDAKQNSGRLKHEFWKYLKEFQKYFILF